MEHCCSVKLQEQADGMGWLPRLPDGAMHYRFLNHGPLPSQSSIRWHFAASALFLSQKSRLIICSVYNIMSVSAIILLTLSDHLILVLLASCWLQVDKDVSLVPLVQRDLDVGINHLKENDPWIFNFPCK